MVTFKRLALTDFKIDIPRLAKKKVLTAALEDSGAGVLHVLSPCTAAMPRQKLSCRALCISPDVFIRHCSACELMCLNTPVPSKGATASPKSVSAVLYQLAQHLHDGVPGHDMALL